MTLTALIELCGLLAASGAAGLLLVSGRRALGREVHFVFMALLLVMVANHAIGIMEWSIMPASFDVVSDFSGFLLPVLWFFLFHTFLHDLSNREIAKAQTRLRHLVSSSPSIIYAMAGNGKRSFTYASENLREILGYASPEMIDDPGFWASCVHPEDVRRAGEEIDRQIEQGAGTVEYRFRRKNGEYLLISDNFRVVRDENGQTTEVVGSWTDITATRRLEETLLQSQKIDTVGRLASGIAHDFNNRLTVILGNLQLLQRKLGDSDTAVAGMIRMAVSATEGAAGLARRLLSFSRSRHLEIRVIDINELISGMSEMLQRTLGENVKVIVSPEAGLWPVKADWNLLENALLNLAVNARDAMPEGGRLTIETGNVTLGVSYRARHDYVKPGDYVMVSVSDTGQGMSSEIKQHIFEPFFTTKEEGKGTGLGLSMIYGFVKQSGGYLEIYSEEGQGTSIKLYLPRDMPPGGTAIVRLETIPDNATAVPARTILLVENDAAIREMAAMQITEMGFRLLAAGNGPEALELLAQHPDVDLLFTDLFMPGGMTGDELANRLRERRPDLRVLFASGFAPRAAADRHGSDHPNDFWLSKPYLPTALRSAIYRALDLQPPGAGSDPPKRRQSG